MGRSPCCAKEGLNRGAWTAMEDKILIEYIKIHGEGKWRHLPKRAGLKRCGKSCRLRWLNYLRPDIKRGNITRDEEDLIIRLHKLLGNRWSLIAGRLPGRTDNEIKNYWNTNIGKKLQNGNSKSSTTTSGGARSSPTTPDPDPDPDPKSPPKTGSCVVRTKATRCTKVIVSRDIMQPLLAAHAPSSVTDDVKVNSDHEKTESESPPFGNSPKEGIISNPLDFMEDFQMDENFFSDLLNMYISEPPSCFEDNKVTVVEDRNASTKSVDRAGLHPLTSPPTSNDTLLNVSEDSLHGSDEGFQSVSALMDNEFDWL